MKAPLAQALFLSGGRRKRSSIFVQKAFLAELAPQLSRANTEALSRQMNLLGQMLHRKVQAAGRRIRASRILATPRLHSSLGSRSTPLVASRFALRGLAEALAGSMGGVADVAASFGAVTVADVRGAHAAMLASKPSLAAVGDLADVPYHATLAQRFS